MCVIEICIDCRGLSGVWFVCVTNWRAAVLVDNGSLSNGGFMWAKAICYIIYTKRKRRKDIIIYSVSTLINHIMFPGVP